MQKVICGKRWVLLFFLLQLIGSTLYLSLLLECAVVSTGTQVSLIPVKVAFNLQGFDKCSFKAALLTRISALWLILKPFHKPIKLELMILEQTSVCFSFCLGPKNVLKFS